MLKIHHLARSRSLRILWLLEEIGTPYEIIRYERDIKTNLAPKDLRSRHPLGKSPLLELDGQIIAESGAITDVLCTRFAPEMIPAVGTPAYFEHLELMHFAEGSAMTPILLKLYTGYLGDAAEPLQPRISSELKNTFSFMENRLRDSGHFVLDNLSAADIMLSFPAQIMTRYGMAETYPKLADFVSQIAARPAFQIALEKGGGD
ncbi:MAG: glutathione S-transferase [Pseudomonadota bacterium]